MAGPVTILHVDDDPAFAELTADMLTYNEPSLEVETYTDPKAALEFIQTEYEHIDCLVTDYQMPTLNGIELLTRIETQHPDQHWPRILFTGEGSEAIAADGLHAGATSYVQKGGTDTFEYLAERIRIDIRAARAEQNSMRFDALTAALDDPVYVLDSKGRFVYVNDAFIKLTGYDRDTIIGSGPSLVKSPASVGAGENHLRQILSSDGPDSITFEISIETAAGETILCEDHMGLLPYDGESFQGSVGTLRDISEQKAREQAITEAKNRYQTLVEQNLVGLYIARNGELIYHNGPFAELFGYNQDSEQLVGDQLTSLVNPSDRLRLTEMVRETELGDRESIREPYVGCQPDGSSVSIQLLARGIELDGTPAVIGTAIDVDGGSDDDTAHLRAERDRLAEFSSIVSHDLRNPLNVATGRAELLAQELDENEHIRPLQESLARMDAIIADLLTLARHGDTLGDTEAVALRTVTTDCWETVATGDAELIVTDDKTIYADQSRLKQLFENLYRNAIEHVGPTVTVTVGALDNGFYIADDGPGVDPELVEDIFTPGYSTQDDGTGFGLAIVEQIVTAHDWTIQCTEGVDGGARFEITGVDTTE